MTDTSLVLLALFVLFCLTRGKLDYKPGPKDDGPKPKPEDD